MNYHVITPFSRFENLKPLAGLLGACGVQWHLLLDETLPFRIHFTDCRIEPTYYPVSAPFWRMWRNSINSFITDGNIIPEDRYMILNDDDWYEPGFFQKIDAHKGKAIVCTMLRGHQTPPVSDPVRAHPTNPLIASPQNMHPGGVGIEQIILSGDLFATVRLADHPHADGMMIQAVYNAMPIDYAPEACVWFNYLEPGRWNK